MPAHTEGPEKRFPKAGDALELRYPGQPWLPVNVLTVNGDRGSFLVEGPGNVGQVLLPHEEGEYWRWPAAAAPEGGGSAEALPCVCPFPRTKCPDCDRLCPRCATVSGEAADARRAGGGSAGGPTLGGVAAVCQNGCVLPIGGDPECPAGTCELAKSFGVVRPSGGGCGDCGAVIGGEHSPDPSKWVPYATTNGVRRCVDCHQRYEYAQAAAKGGGSVQCHAALPPGAEPCLLPRGHGGKHDDGRMLWGFPDAEPDPTPLPPVHRCPERVSAAGEAIENCDAVIGRDVQCFVCLGVRCFVHCGCLQHHLGAKIVHRGGAGSFEWAIWEMEHAFRGQLYAKAADGSGLVILGTHGGASSDAVLTILLSSLERIQGRKVRDPRERRGEVIGQSEQSRPTNEAAGELENGGDPEVQMRELDARVVLLLADVKRKQDDYSALLHRKRVWLLRICEDWMRITEQRWRDLADDGEQNPRLVFQCKELHDQQVSDLFFQIAQLFNGGDS